MKYPGMERYETVIGLEVHVELLTASKMFCGCSARFGAPANTQVCPVCLGLPGVLPVLNCEAIRLAIKTALAFRAQVSDFCRFARKNYFYPDLPKNYQISQYEEPLATGGWLEMDSRRIGLHRIHLEEDAGKLLHSTAGENFSLVDLNRAGVPLMEIVSEPDLKSPEEAEKYLELLKQNLEYLAVSDCNMEEGSLRCDANISVRKSGADKLGVKTEVKNMNSFKAVRKALTFEISRQISLGQEGREVIQETRLWNEKLGVTESMRGKESAHDYRYFPEPDLLPVRITRDLIEEIKRTIGELPAHRRKRFENLGLSAYAAGVLTSRKDVADYFEECAGLCQDVKPLANWIMGELMALVNERKAAWPEMAVRPALLVELVKLIKDGRITATAGKEVLREVFDTGRSPSRVVEEKGLEEIRDTDFLGQLVQEAISQNPEALQDYRNGKEQVLGFLIGQVMRKAKGKVNPRMVQQALKEAMENR